MERGLQRINQQQKLAVWCERVESCRSSGLTVREWCNQNNVSLGSYYKWQKTVYELSVKDEPKFIEIPMQNNSKPSIQVIATIPFGDSEIRIYNGAEADTLTALLRAI